MSILLEGAGRSGEPAGQGYDVRFQNEGVARRPFQELPGLNTDALNSRGVGSSPYLDPGGSEVRADVGRTSKL